MGAVAPVRLCGDGRVFVRFCGLDGYLSPPEAVELSYLLLVAAGKSKHLMRGGDPLKNRPRKPTPKGKIKNEC